MHKSQLSLTFEKHMNPTPPTDISKLQSLIKNIGIYMDGHLISFVFVNPTHSPSFKTIVWHFLKISNPHVINFFKSAHLSNEIVTTHHLVIKSYIYIGSFIIYRRIVAGSQISRWRKLWSWSSRLTYHKPSVLPIRLSTMSLATG